MCTDLWNKPLLQMTALTYSIFQEIWWRHDMETVSGKKCSLGDWSFLGKRRHYLKENLTWLKSSGLSLYIYVLFTMFTMHFDVEFSSVSIASGSPTIDKIAMFWSSCRHNADAPELSANHTLQSMTTTCWWRRWQADGLLSCCYNGGHIVKLCRQKRRNYVRIGAISSQPYQQLVNEGLKILGG